MRKIINRSALIVFILLLLDAFRIPEMFLYFLIIGAVPGTSETLSPSLMLAILTTATMFLLFEMLAHRMTFFGRIRSFIASLPDIRDKLSRRPVSRASPF